MVWFGQFIRRLFGPRVPVAIPGEPGIEVIHMMGVCDDLGMVEKYCDWNPCVERDILNVAIEHKKWRIIQMLHDRDPITEDRIDVLPFRRWTVEDFQAFNDITHIDWSEGFQRCLHQVTDDDRVHSSTRYE